MLDINQCVCQSSVADFLPETAHIRNDPTWQGAPPAPGLVDRRIEITGPVDRKMVINALNSGATQYMADFEGEWVYVSLTAQRLTPTTYNGHSTEQLGHQLLVNNYTHRHTHIRCTAAVGDGMHGGMLIRSSTTANSVLFYGSSLS